MSDRKPTTTSNGEGAPHDDVLPSLPDGGLSEKMPDWLRRPPAWRSLPKADAAREPDTPAAVVRDPETVAAAPPRVLPEPDTSVIDPRTLVDVADLPEWLQEIAAREQASDPVVVTVDDEVIPQEETTMDTNQQPGQSDAPEGVERSVKFEPTDRKAWEAPEEETTRYGARVERGSNTPLMLALGIIALLVIVVILILVL